MESPYGDEGREQSLRFEPSRNDRERRSLNRRLFREMIKTQLEEGALSWLKRRTLVRFGVRLGLDAFEAQMIVRAVEFEGGSAKPAAISEFESSVRSEYIASSGAVEGGSWLTAGALMALSVIGAALVLLAWR
ncbi:MAG TPA: hypothetical protein VNT79_00125 [Phycisphaerae bacterium]|nr:hypothetical protein [Phycisphaerae bacterium]